MTIDYGPDGSCWLRCEAPGCLNAAGPGDVCDEHRRLPGAGGAAGQTPTKENDLETIRLALCTGRISAAKVDAQRAFKRLLDQSSLGDKSEPTDAELDVAMAALAEIEAGAPAPPPVTHVDWIDYGTGKTHRREVFSRSFLEHAAITGSQYDGTCRLMAAHILALLDHLTLMATQRDGLLKEIESCADQRNELRRALAGSLEDCAQLRKAHQATLEERDRLALEVLKP